MYYLNFFVFALLLLIPASSNANSQERFEQFTKKKIKMVVTAYYKPLRNQKIFRYGNYHKEVEINGKGKTFSGKHPQKGMVAADLKVFPLGTYLNIPDYGIAVVEDVGQAIKGHRLDLYMGEGEEGLKKAIQWGKREVEVEIIQFNQGGS
jgi:3D (Asp-Asp-Asp) domain-containing protein